MQLTVIDWAVVALYFLFNLAIGLYYRARAIWTPLAGLGSCCSLSARGPEECNCCAGGGGESTPGTKFPQMLAASVVSIALSRIFGFNNDKPEEFA